MNGLGIGIVYTSFRPVAGGSVSLEKRAKGSMPVPGWFSTGLSTALCLFRVLQVVRAHLSEVCSPKAKTFPN